MKTNIIVQTILGATAALWLCACGSVDVESAEIESVGEAELAVQTLCGGFGGALCPHGYVCVDDPRDECDPASGGADCAGVCEKDKKEKMSCEDPDRQYVSTSPEDCALIHFVCVIGSEPFFDACGCGCETPR
jgi:hypothetical protein